LSGLAAKLAEIVDEAPRPGVGLKLDGEGFDDDDRTEIVRLHVDLGYSARHVARLLTDNGAPISANAVLDWLRSRKAYRERPRRQAQ
jgi:hypothetical protein